MSLKVKCIILDDELPGLTYLKLLCEQIPFAEVVRCYSSPSLFLKDQKDLDFDVCLLDVNMPDINGIEIAQLLRDKIIIFTSAFPEFAANAYELEALDFIRKPITRERLEKALLKAQKALSERSPAQAFFSWNTNLGKSAIYFEEVIFITSSEIDKRDKIACLKNGQQLTLKNITYDKLLELLPKESFIQVNKSDIITRKAIQAYTAEEIVLKPEGQPKLSINLGESYKKDFLAWIK